MISILLIILKIIGVILLVLLGLILLILCLVLFAPVKYQAQGAKHPEEIRINAFISYLRPLVRVRIAYPGEPLLSVKILWLDLLKPRGEKKTGDESSKKKTNKKQAPGKKSPEKPPDEKRRMEKQILQKPPDEEPLTEKPLTPSFTEMSAGMESGSAHPLVTFREENVVREEAVVREKTVSRTENKREKTTSSKEPEKKKASHEEGSHQEKEENRLSAIAALLWQYKEMYPDVLGKVFKALKTILPRKCNIHLVFGTGSPETTGYLYGAYCALQEYLPGTVEFVPVWMESYLDVDFELSGKVRVIHFVTAAVKIIADKRVRHFISEIRRI